MFNLGKKLLFIKKLVGVIFMGNIVKLFGVVNYISSSKFGENQNNSMKCFTVIQIPLFVLQTPKFKFIQICQINTEFTNYF